MRHDVGKMGISCKYPGIDGPRGHERGVKDEAKPQRQFEPLKSRAIAREHWVFENGETKRVDLRPNRIKSWIIELKSVNIRPDNDTLHAKPVNTAIKFCERALDVFQRQACETNKPIGMPPTHIG